MTIPPEDWELVGGNPVPGDPATVSARAQDFRTICDDAGDVHRRLKQVQDSVDDAIWRGKAAGEFRGKIEKLPEHLEKLHDSYDKAAAGTATYAVTLRDLIG